MSTIALTSCESLPPKNELDAILGQYYDLIMLRMNEIGLELDPAAPKSALAEFWAHADDYLPPNGCFIVARDAKGRMVGCGMLKRLDAQTGELKRVFVAESARGTGTGRRIIEMREEVARAMGLKTLVADTLTPNVEMRSLYPKLGFVEVAGPLETTTYRDQPMIREHLHFFIKDISG